MASRDDDRFRIRPAAPKSRTGPRSQRFVSQVLKEVSKAGAKASGTRGGQPANTFGRGRVASGMAGQRLQANARRVIIKARFVVLKKAGANSVPTHLRYIERDGVTRDGQKGQAYGSDRGKEVNTADLRAFEDRGKGDRHQFRFIVSPEDAVEIDDLRGYTRQLMWRMEIDLETRLDWVAVDHWDTDNPHTHVVLNGRAADGQDLVIAPHYLAHGMRMRASEIATEWLGPRTETEMRQSLQREVDQQRLTALDRALLRQASMNIVDLSGCRSEPQRQNALRARLQRLEAMDLAERLGANRWRLAPDLGPTLGAMGERQDALDAMRRALKGEQRELVVDDAQGSTVVGRIAGKGLYDELNDRSYVVVDGIDGRAHYLRLPSGSDLSAWPSGGIVEAGPAVRERPVDRAILTVSREGIYRVSDHLAQLPEHPHETVEVHVRRLEALRRGGIVERAADGVWRVPSDFLVRARQHDARKAVGPNIELRSHLSIDQQMQAIGATWLDRRLMGGGQGQASRGFGKQVQDAQQRRAEYLTEQGLAEHRGQRLVLARNLLATLRDRELATVGRELQASTGQIYRPLRDGEAVNGIYQRSIQLASGRFAMLDDGMGFSLVPWRPLIEQRLGQHVSALVRGSSVDWTLGRKMGIGR
ncbi:MAG TPA: DUF3363 domain-containing protein [Polaromonas sp.]|uniref:DUF3363 domain-containing protein n=1 Tax=Polaromonas sp. TaxID=1869339 RepID=UPI002D3BB83F|nr:DUF3363 domain-containing protein [Polaromonas sp.]HYW55790.1 DUF3363 domain-containing protein [Polaromonas sp.]